MQRMDTIWLTLYAVTVVLALLAAFLLAFQSWEHRRFARKRLSKSYRQALNKQHDQKAGMIRSALEPAVGTPTAKARQERIALFVPCKGIDLGLEENLRPLFHQNHDNYEIVWIVESVQDPAHPVIEKLIAENPRIDSKMVISGVASDAGQKVHNLRQATRDLDPEISILAFVDSDARPDRDWLVNLAYRLDRAGVGITTGYRWFIPERPTLANHLLYSINATTASLLSPKGKQPAWGGSWAMRRDLFDGLGLHARWDGMLTDDLVVSNLVHEANLHVEFIPNCMLASPVDLTFTAMVQFLRRQYMIGRHYMPRLWALTLGTTTIMILGFWGTLFAAGVGLVTRASWTWLPASACSALYLWNLYRASIRSDLADIYFPKRKKSLTLVKRFDTLASPLAALVNWMTILSTVGARHFDWRGITYRLLPHGLTRIVRRQGENAHPSLHGNEGATAKSTSEYSHGPSPSRPGPHHEHLTSQPTATGKHQGDVSSRAA
jgi:ceramide glucosyltransferase